MAMPSMPAVHSDLDRGPPRRGQRKARQASVSRRVLCPLFIRRPGGWIPSRVRPLPRGPGRCPPPRTRPHSASPGPKPSLALASSLKPDGPLPQSRTAETAQDDLHAVLRPERDAGDSLSEVREPRTPTEGEGSSERVSPFVGWSVLVEGHRGSLTVAARSFRSAARRCFDTPAREIPRTRPIWSSETFAGDS